MGAGGATGPDFEGTEELVAGTPGGGRGAPLEGPLPRSGPGVGSVPPPRGGRPVGATVGMAGMAGLGPKVGTVDPSVGAILGAAGVGERAGGGATDEAGAETEGFGARTGLGEMGGVGKPVGGTGGEPGVVSGGEGVGTWSEKGCLVTLNLGAPGGRGLTGSPSLGVSFRDGRGGSGVGAGILVKDDVYLPIMNQEYSF